MQKNGKRILTLIFSFAFCIMWNLAVSALTWEKLVLAGNLQELQNWYYDKNAKASDMCTLKQDIVIDTTVILSDVSKIREIVAIDYKIRVTKTGQLILNSPTVYLSGPGKEPAIEVAAGGRLELNQGKCYMPADAGGLFNYGAKEQNTQLKTGRNSAVNHVDSQEVTGSGSSFRRNRISIEH